MIDEDRSLVVSQPRVFSLDEMVAIWLHAKAIKSGLFYLVEQYTQDVPLSGTTIFKISQVILNSRVK